MTEQILSGRYRIEEAIGGGGMAVVYRAVDELLGRTVAVKMLRPQFAGDEEFVSRFRQEAQAAAKLSHPNIVNLYDVGMSGNEYFIVMEYVDGPTLKDLIKSKGALPVEEVVDISAQICEALAHAHEHRIIHRDIKPHNILLTKSGIVKVTDFGIARAVTGTTITDRQATSVLGSVHYFSPEQARGGQTDVKSDIYSLGVVMYEMLTGELPFSGDSPVSVALKHLREEFVEPRQIDRSIPQSIENIVLRALAKSPSARYPDMESMLADLNDALKTPNVPKFILPKEATEETIAIPVVRDGALMSTDRNKGKQKGKKKQKKKRSWWQRLLMVILVLVVIVLGGLAALYILMRVLAVPNVALPSVVGETESQAVATLESAGFKASQIHEETGTSKQHKGIVFDQSPQGPTKVKQTRTITLYVSTGAPRLKMPDLTGVTEDEAKLTLMDAGFSDSHIVVKTESSSNTPSGEVISTEPTAGSEVQSDATVTLYVSSQPATTVVPNVVGMTYQDALKALQAANLQVGQVTPVASTQPNQTVVQTSPAVGTTVKPNTVVNLDIADNTGQTTSPTNSTGTGNSTSPSGSTPTSPSEPPAGSTAHEVKVTVPVNPGSPPVQVEIDVNDAEGNDQTVVQQTITKTTSWTETIYLMPGTTGQVDVYLNGQLAKQFTVQG
ncbi:Stk1 family PASTA domain-containing Ser/Thr kinase [Alicyclobacillus sp. SP_1]|uniref:Stk1 family PASTA domain-containing Ser/Thr kinase n=1 Tax=Alicyclobacillus sp. SP_1 TaxID=2942475 RepID=UPI0021584953|nr:Stk1 family PASTA domain-containing Ser/Thr kinase [Alicyclobacillus sp. SP_1]